MKIQGFPAFLLPWFCACVLFICLIQVNDIHTHPHEDELSLVPENSLDKHNSSEVLDAEDGSDLVPMQEEHVDDSGMNTPPTVLNSVPDDVFTHVESSHVETPNEIINNDTPIVISRVDSASEELQKRADTLSPLNPLPEVITTTESNITLETLHIAEAEVNTTANAEERKEAPQNATEDIPSFSEWAQKRLEEAEKNQEVNLSGANASSNGNKQNAKLRWKNYAAVDCGAKVILANPEAQHTWAILVGSRDEYALNPCSSRIWFIVELCEAIQLKKVELANYELFSSSPQEFSVSVSDRFPTRDWNLVGQFTAKDERDVQDFYVDTETFGKYVKVEIKSHYGSEHFCPLSLFRAYGTSVFEVLQKDDPAHEQPFDDDEDDDALDVSETASSNNLLSSATDAVISMVKKAAQALGNKVSKSNESSQLPVKSESTVVKSCSSPSHYVVCNNCSDTLFGKIFELLSCRQKYIKNLVAVPFIRHALERSTVCQTFGLDFREKSAANSLQSGYLCVESFFPESFLGAMCNVLAVAHHKVLYNVSYQFPNGTARENILSVAESAKKVQPVLEPNLDDALRRETEHLPTEPLTVDLPDINTKSGCSTDTSYTSQIKPTKSIVTELPVHSELNTSQLVTKQSDQAEESTAGSSESQPAEEVVDVDAAGDQGSEGNVVEENVTDKVAEINAEGSPAVNNLASAGSVQGQKESVFLRLSNRIKALERNMSLSGQYLEELSKRYKKQVEEMQRVIEKTETTLRDVSTTKDERYKRLEEKLESLAQSVDKLSAEKEGWKVLAYWLLFVVASTFLGYCFKRVSGPRCCPNSPSDKLHPIQRRNSVDVVTTAPVKKKKRRPSDQALKIVTSAASGDQPRKRKKKSSVPLKCADGSEDEELFSPPCTSSRIWQKKSNPDWVEGRGRVVEDIPFPLEEADSSVEGLPPVAELRNIDPPSYQKTARHFRLGRASFRNGGFKSASEVMKKRHSSPVSSLDGSIGSAHDHSPKKERKGLRKLLKKVF